ncbi:MAG: hypothetical protein KBA51_06470 [Kiritimatiellae bacterium]|nr:hypothetical protein [Kiritimatiellia bacterium]
MREVPERWREKYSSAVTLSDMEVFVFPELLYSLVLANIMSPRIWAWREDPWFAKLDRMTPYRRILRLKQFIIDHYEFNLDLDTWGLTDKATELRRFEPFLSTEELSRSNALFGYEGDHYYFDLDIRRHFGLDQYTSDIIPYWKTETVEAMNAFSYRPGYRQGAGECVSLSTLYAAAMFIVCGIPLEDIFLMATPLHSQNFVLSGDGVITNNRRLVTKTMWFNGTELTAKAQRALRHEQITIVAHCTGHVHCLYPEATNDPAAYARFQQGLREFMRTPITMEILANFLREHSARQSCFQIRHERHGRALYLPAEKAYAYEHNSSFKVSDATRPKLLAEIDEDEYFRQPIEGRVLLEDVEQVFRSAPVDPDRPDEVRRLIESVQCSNFQAGRAIEELVGFARLEPRFPDAGAPRAHVAAPAIRLRTGMSREEIIAQLESERESHPVADLAFYAFRDLSRTDWRPFLQAALERNPVCVKATEGRSDEDMLAALTALPGESIYDGARAAQPDEVWNFGRGDGFEKAVAAAAILRRRHPELPMRLTAEGQEAQLQAGDRMYSWPSAKGLRGAANL